MISRLPIRLRLMLPFALGMAIVLAATGFLIYHRVAATLLSSIDQSLRGQAVEATHHVDQGRAMLDRDAPGSASVGQLVSADGHVLGDLAKGCRGSSPRELHTSSRTPKAGHTADTRPRRPMARRRCPAPRSRRAAIVVASSLGPATRRLIGWSGSSCSAARSRSPLRRSPDICSPPARCGRSRPCAVEPHRSARSTPGARLPEPRSRDELFRLAETLNEMLARLESAVEHERRFVDDASHELRTPLALLRTELELALRRPRSKQELERALRSAAEESDRLGRLAEDLLLFARYDQGLLPLRQSSTRSHCSRRRCTVRRPRARRRAHAANRDAPPASSWTATKFA